MLNEEKDEVTFYQFLSELKSFLRDLLQHPVKSELDDFFKSRGFSKSKLIEYLIKTEMIKKTEKVNSDDPENVTLEVSYLIPKKGFERKVQKMFIKLFEIREDIDKSCLIEGLSDVLYHFTRFDRLLDILDSDEMKDNVDQDKANFYFSFSRVKNASIGYARNEKSHVRITFDGRMLSYNFKGNPFDYYKKSQHTWERDSDLSGKERRRQQDNEFRINFNDEKSSLNTETEFEDRIEVPSNKFNKNVKRVDSGIVIKNISRYIRRIDVYVSEKELDIWWIINRLVRLHENKLSNIIFIYTDKKDFDLQTNNTMKVTDFIEKNFKGEYGPL